MNTEFNASPGSFVRFGSLYRPGSLYSELIKGATPTNPVDIYICGEALSHCVNYSLRHLVEKLIEDEAQDNKKHVKVHLVLNCSSTVVLKGIETVFFGNSSQLINDILIKYKDYCDIVFWNGSALISSEYIVKKTKNVFNAMAAKGGYVEGTYQSYLDSKHGLTVADDAAKEVEALNKAFNEEVAKVAPAEAKGEKRTKKKRRSKTQKKRKGQIKKSKRHRRSRK